VPSWASAGAEVEADRGVFEGGNFEHPADERPLHKSLKVLLRPLSALKDARRCNDLARWRKLGAKRLSSCLHQWTAQQLQGCSGTGDETCRAIRRQNP
jgi:hypothetical protein